MIKKMIRVPKYEAYYFCKRIFFSILGDACNSFSDCILESGWVAYPYYTDKVSEPNLLLFSNEQNLSNIISIIDDKNPNMHCKYNIGIIITDAEAMSIEQIEFFDEIIDLTSLKDYYQTELSLDTFIKNVLELTK